MRLYAHPDFTAIVVAAREHLGIPGLTEQLIEKDYFVTEMLRIVAASLPAEAIFKGGTSLSKGWDIIRRFSEDVDLFVDPKKFSPPLGKNGIDRTLKKLRDQVGQHPAFTLTASKPSGGFGRADDFAYPQSFGGIAAVKSTVLLEAGTASGREPVVTLDIESYVARFLREAGVELEAEDRSTFPMRVMHFRRTFVEKMFAIHAKVELFKEGGKPIGTYARHYYDLFCLLLRPEVPDMLRTEEYAHIKDDYRSVSLASFPRDYREPDGMSFASSDALFPEGGLRAAIRSDYTVQCANLCYGAIPAFEQVEEALAQVRGLL
ncbi:nucleotidyl transferase AbiEii/AbiGii toxin family protein [bacterium]|nr:MAG: nucleotidyl transferase AbiEii/AbiGii toxin family protein [bacterium]